MRRAGGLPRQPRAHLGRGQPGEVVGAYAPVRPGPGAELLRQEREHDRKVRLTVDGQRPHRSAAEPSAERGPDPAYAGFDRPALAEVVAGSTWCGRQSQLEVGGELVEIVLGRRLA